MHWYEKHVLSILEVEPWLVLVCRYFKNRERWTIIWDSEVFRPHQRFDNLLRPIAMVHIKVNNRDFLNLVAILAKRIRCCHCNIVNEAEAIRARFPFVLWVVCFTEYSSVMPRWACRTESIPNLSCHNFIHSLNCSTSWNQGSFPCLFWRVCVHVIKNTDHFVVRATQLCNVLHHLLNVVEVVDLQYVSYFGSLVHTGFQNKSRAKFLRKLNPLCE